MLSRLRSGGVWIVFGVLAALLLSYLGLLIARPASESSTLIDGWGVAAFNITASCMCIARGLTRKTGRLVPLVLGASLLAWGLGDLTLTIESLGGAEPSTPSVADGFYLTFFPLAYVGIVMFIRGEVRRLSTPSWLDSAIAALGAAAICATFVFSDLVRTGGESALAVATNLAYPVGDVLLLALVVGSAAMLAGRSRAPWILLATGMALNAVGDTFNLLGSGVGATSHRRDRQRHRLARRDLARLLRDVDTSRPSRSAGSCRSRPASRYPESPRSPRSRS